MSPLVPIIANLLTAGLSINTIINGTMWFGIVCLAVNFAAIGLVCGVELRDRFS